MNVLYIANALPYDRIRHAGGKTFNYYIKNLSKTGKHNIVCIGIAKREELKLLQAEEKNCVLLPVVSRGGVVKNCCRVLYDLAGIIFRRKSYGQSYYKTYHILKNIRKLKREGFQPNIIVLEWTNCVLMAEPVKKIFPNAKLIASEHDVTFLSAHRQWQRADKNQQKYKRIYDQVKKRELDALALCDIIMPQNEKDKRLLVENGVAESKIHILTPYYHNMSEISREEINSDILFWGAMNRPENYEAALWFIDNVMPLLRDTNVRFIAAGNRPPEQLTGKANDRVIVTGFVEDERDLFAHSLCFVAPLQMGAGVKVKVIEALSAGIPVLTNEIGIEGIPAQNGREYIHCETAKEYENAIRNLLVSKEKSVEITEAQREFMSRHYDLEQSVAEYLHLFN